MRLNYIWNWIEKNEFVNLRKKLIKLFILNFDNHEISSETSHVRLMLQANVERDGNSGVVLYLFIRFYETPG